MGHSVLLGGLNGPDANVLAHFYDAAHHHHAAPRYGNALSTKRIRFRKLRTIGTQSKENLRVIAVVEKADRVASLRRVRNSERNDIGLLGCDRNEADQLREAGFGPVNFGIHLGGDRFGNFDVESDRLNRSAGSLYSYGGYVVIVAALTTFFAPCALTVSAGEAKRNGERAHCTASFNSREHIDSLNLQYGK